MIWSEPPQCIRYIAIYILSCGVQSIYCDVFCPAEQLRYMTCRLTSDISSKEFHHYSFRCAAQQSTNTCQAGHKLYFWDSLTHRGAKDATTILKTCHWKRNSMLLYTNPNYLSELLSIRKLIWLVWLCNKIIL